MYEAVLGTTYNQVYGQYLVLHLNKSLLKFCTFLGYLYISFMNWGVRYNLSFYEIM